MPANNLSWKLQPPAGQQVIMLLDGAAEFKRCHPSYGERENAELEIRRVGSRRHGSRSTYPF